MSDYPTKESWWPSLASALSDADAASERRGYAKAIAIVEGAKMIGASSIGPLYGAGWNGAVEEILKRLTPPPRPETAETTGTSEPRWRVGRTLGRTLYLDGQCVGIVDTKVIAEGIVYTMNRDPRWAPPPRPETAACTCGGYRRRHGYRDQTTLDPYCPLHGSAAKPAACTCPNAAIFSSEQCLTLDGNDGKTVLEWKDQATDPECPTHGAKPAVCKRCMGCGFVSVVLGPSGTTAPCPDCQGGA